MTTRLLKYGSVALGALLVLPGMGDAAAQGPVRNTARGAAQATGNAVRRTGQAAGNTARAATPPYNGNYSSGYRGTNQANGAYANGQQQYGQQQYNNSGQAAIQNGQGQNGQTQYGQHQNGQMQSQAGNQGYATTGPVYVLQHDSCGREFICQNGHRVYFTNQSSQTNSNLNQMNSNDQMNSNQSNSDQMNTDQNSNQSQPATSDQQTGNQQNGQQQTANKPVTDNSQIPPQDGQQTGANLQQDANAGNSNLNSDTQIQSGQQGNSISTESNLNSDLPDTPQAAADVTGDAG